jgi:hypothetical protein
MKWAAEWGGDVMMCGLTPPRLASRCAQCESTLPLQGRVRKIYGLFGSKRFSNPFQQSA